MRPQMRYTQETDWIFTRLPQIVMIGFTIVTFLLPFTPFTDYLPHQEDLRFANAFFLCMALTVYMNSAKDTDEIIGQLNTAFIAFGAAMVVSLLLLVYPLLGKTAPLLSFSVAIQFLIILEEVKARRFPLLLFLWSFFSLLLTYTNQEIPAFITLGMLYPISRVQAWISQSKQQGSL